MDKSAIQAIVTKHGLSVESTFIPWSKSRNKAEKDPSLNWKVRLVKTSGSHKRIILETDYSAGCGYCPSYKRSSRDRKARIDWECENGFEARELYSLGHIVAKNNKPIPPDPLDVIYSLLLESEVLDYDDYESWASEFGYDPDSRKGERLYQECMRIALQFRQLSEGVIEELREAYQDY